MLRRTPRLAPARTTRRRSLRATTRLAVPALALALAVTGCSTDSGPDGTDKALPGVTSSSVELAFSIVDIGDVAASIGFQQPAYGGYDLQKKAIDTLVASVNADGGMGGRQITSTINRYLGISDSPEQSAAQCKGFTQDHSVMAAILDGGYQNNTVPCFVAANTLLINQTLQAQDQDLFEKNSPYLWAPSNPEYGSFVQAQLEAMDEAGFFEGSTGVLIMPSDDEVSRRTTSTIVEPFLKDKNTGGVTVSYIDSTNTGTLGATISEALTTARSRKLNRVIPIGGARIEPVALNDFLAKDFVSRWAVSTYDNPYFTAHNPKSIQTELRNGMVGIGYAPAQDVDDDQGPPFPDPNNAAQTKCVETITAGGAAPPNNQRADWKMVFYYCDAIYFLKAVLDQMPGTDEVTGEQFKDAVAKLGTTYQSAFSLGSAWGPGVYAGTNTAMKLSWDGACECFVYDGEPFTFGASQQSAPSSSGAAEAWPSAP